MVCLNQSLVSVIITTYNHAKFIEKAIKSAISQTYGNIEIIIIDDGSTDNTKQVIQKYPDIIYFYQNNKGLSNARNTGVSLSKGEFIVFLDADDWLFPKAVHINYEQICGNSKAAFVSGRHYKVHTYENYINLSSSKNINTDDYFPLFLEMGNFIEMHATVLYRRSILKEFKFDENLSSCEDYDIYLRISRYHSVLFHDEIMAAYRRHDSNMSSNYVMMLHDALFVLDKQLPSISSFQEKKAYRKGREFWTRYYINAIYWKLSYYKRIPTKAETILLLKYQPALLLRYFVKLLLKK